MEWFCEWVILFFLTGMIFSGVNSCSDYLVSGADGVKDSMFNASSSLSGYEPHMARLYLSGTGSGWCGNGSNVNSSEYIQVEFNEISTLKTLLMQSAADSKGWLTHFSVAYSTDGSTWKTFKSGGKDKLYQGNINNSTVKTNGLGNIKTKFLRIIPKNWVDWPCLRFDVLGCSTTPLPEIKHYYGEYVPLKVDDTMTSSRVWTKYNTKDLPACLEHCDGDAQCLSFAFNQSEMTCEGYDAQFYRNDLLMENRKIRLLEEMENKFYYFDRSKVDKYGYTVNRNEGVCYNIYTQRKTSSQANTACVRQTARVLPVANSAQLQVMQTIVGRSSVLDNEPGLHVDGSRKNGKWVHFNDMEIDNNLWATGKNDSSLGTCVVITSKGLSAANCNQKLFYICGL